MDRKTKLRLLLPMLLALSTPAAAQVVMPCDWQAGAQNIVEPWEQNTRTFANGNVRLAFLDTIEPAAGYAYLMILSPPLDELGGRQCVVVGYDWMGFAGMDFAGLAADYDPAIGLLFDLPVWTFDPNRATPPRRLLHVTLNQATGAVGARLKMVGK